MKTESLLRPPLSQVLKSGRVTLSPGEHVGQHVTEKKEEIIVVLKGTATLVLDSEKVILGAGHTKFIPEGVVHDVLNESDALCEYVYVVGLLDVTY